MFSGMIRLSLPATRLQIDNTKHPGPPKKVMASRNPHFNPEPHQQIGQLIKISTLVALKSRSLEQLLFTTHKFSAYSTSPDTRADR